MQSKMDKRQFVMEKGFYSKNAELCNKIKKWIK